MAALFLALLTLAAVADGAAAAPQASSDRAQELFRLSGMDRQLGSFGATIEQQIRAETRIPEPLYEAARIDGASVWRQFRHVTLPLLAPVVSMVNILTIAGYFQLFAEPYVMTQGGPSDSTLSVVLLMYEEGFRWWNLGYGAAVAVVLFVVILAASVLQLVVQRRSVA